MRYLSFVLALATLSVGAPALADSLSYNNVGSVATASVLTASATGSITGSFIGQNAFDTSAVRMVDITTGYTSGFFFNNHGTSAGATANFGSVNAGDVIVFELFNFNTGLTLATDAAHSADGLNHGYEVPFGGGKLNGVDGLPGGTFVGMEDLTGDYSDWDYDDTVFFFTNVASAPITGHAPEPGTLALLGTGLLGAAGLLGRRLYAR